MKWLIVIYLCFSFPVASMAKETIRLTTGEFPPFTSQNLKYNGVINRIVSAAFALEGITVEYGWYPWKRAYSQARDGNWNGSSYFKKTPEREKDFIFSDRLTSSYYVFFHKKEYDFNWSSLQDLNGIPVGGTLGYFYEEIFSPLEKSGELDVQWANNDEANLGKLLKGRIRVFPSNLDATYYLLNKKFQNSEAKEITFHPKSLSESDSYLILSKKMERNKHYMKLFNRGLKRLIDSGEYDQYFAESRRGEYD